jgi:hypothetical protein
LLFVQRTVGSLKKTSFFLVLSKKLCFFENLRFFEKANTFFYKVKKCQASLLLPKKTTFFLISESIFDFVKNVKSLSSQKAKLFVLSKKTTFFLKTFGSLTTSGFLTEGCQKPKVFEWRKHKKKTVVFLKNRTAQVEDKRFLKCKHNKKKHNRSSFTLL